MLKSDEILKNTHPRISSYGCTDKKESIKIDLEEEV